MPLNPVQPGSGIFCHLATLSTKETDIIIDENLFQKNEPHLFFEVPKRLRINFEWWFLFSHVFIQVACLVLITTFTLQTPREFHSFFVTAKALSFAGFKRTNYGLVRLWYQWVPRKWHSPLFLGLLKLYFPNSRVLHEQAHQVPKRHLITMWC